MRRSILRLIAITTAALTAVAVGPFGPAGVAQAVPIRVGLSQTSVTIAPDFAGERYADAWDYANTADMSLVPLFGGERTSGLSYSGGVFNATVAAGGWLNLVNTIPGSIAYGRDGRAIPIDANQYTRFSVRMWSSRDNIAQVWWKTCPEANTACYGAVQFATKAGWGTYDVGLSKIPQTAANWSGSIVGLQINPTGQFDGRIALDWTRVYEPKAENRVTVSHSGAAGELVIDQDTNPTNGNETLLRQNGTTVPVAANGTVTLDSSLLPAGAWWIGVRTGGGTDYAGAALTVVGAPMPVVLDPDVAGGSDVHDVMGGSAWDFNEAGDIAALSSVADANISGGILYGRNGTPNNWDSQVGLTMPGLIDGSRFHRVTLKVGYDGPWGLQDAPGGGMMSRLVWQTNSNPAAYQDLDDVVVLPGDQTISIDLATNPAAAIVDGDNPNKIGWAGQQIKSLRFDPDEDPSNARTWRIDDIRIAQDDRGGTGFSVKYKDANWAPNTVADIYVDRGTPGQNRTQVAAGIAVNQGVNSYVWSLGNLPAGTYWVLVAMRRGNAAVSAFSTGPVQMDGSGPGPAAVAAPFGSLDAVSQVGADGVRFQGWAIDPALGAAPATVHVYVDGRAQAVAARGTRSDVGAAYGLGSDHGFDVTMTGVAAGRHNTCAYAVRATGNVLLGCRPIVIQADPVGNVDSVQATNGGVKINGWALDRSTAASIAVHAYVDGQFAGAATAGLGRGDIGAAYPNYGPNHGFSFAVPAGPGNHTVCVYALDQVAPGGNILLGCYGIGLPSAPFGSWDSISRSGDRVDLGGWALDPLTLSPAAVHVYVDGVGALATSTSVVRSDVSAAYPGYFTSTQGFRASVTVGGGAHRVCVYAVGSGGSPTLGCRTV